MECKHCGEASYRKDGIVRGEQRYLCTLCGRRFVATDGRKRYSDQQKLAALALYREGIGFRGIGRLLGVSYVTVMRWMQSMGDEVKGIIRSGLPEDLSNMDMVLIDEMWHYTQENATNCGYGLLSLPSPDASSPAKWVLVALKPSSDSGPASNT